MTPVQPADPREPATNLKALTVLVAVGLILLNTAFLYSPSMVVLGLIVFCLLGSGVACWIVRCVWYRRCWTNAELLLPGSQRYRRGWTVGLWFVPLVNIWLSRQMTLDIRRASGLPDDGIVNLWWGVNLALIPTAAAVAFRDLHQAAVLVECTLLAVKAVAFIRIVGQVTARQAEALDLPPVREFGERAVQRA